MMQLSEKGVTALKKREGKNGEPSLVAYRDSGGVLTAGWGHTGSDVQEGLTYSIGQCDKWFADDTAWAVKSVNALVKVKLTQDQFDALVSFIFNVGNAAFANSTLLKKLNNGDYGAVPLQMKRWVYVDKERDQGLINRRHSEIGQWITGSYVRGSEVTAEPPIAWYSHPVVKKLGTALGAITVGNITTAASNAQTAASTWHVFAYVAGALSALAVIWALFEHVETD